MSLAGKETIILIHLCLILLSTRTILVQMVSAAGTGYFFNTKRNRLKDKLVLRKHDPFGKKRLNRLYRL